MRIKMQWMGVAAAAVLSVVGSGAASAQSRNDWTGIYVGANAGGSANHAHWSYFNNPGQTVTRDFGAFAYGMQAGAQLQMGQVVLGAEFGLSGYKGDSTGPDSPLFAPRFNTEAQTKSVLTIGPRLGWAFNNWMIYGTGGYARVNTETAFVQIAGPNEDRRTASADGWFAGGGVEWAVSRNWILGFEYRHIEAEKKLSGPAIPVTDVSRYVDASIDEFKARLSFKLGN